MISGAPVVFAKAKVLVEGDRAGIVLAHVQPDFIGILLAGMFHGLVRQHPADAPAPVIGVGGHIGN